METFDPIVIGQSTKPKLKNDTVSVQIKRPTRLEEEEKHNVTISEMGDFEKFHRTSGRIQRIRVPVLTDEQNVEINRIYFGNPFKLLQTGSSNRGLTVGSPSGIN
jgi:hypothetical protein